MNLKLLSGVIVILTANFSCQPRQTAKVETMKETKSTPNEKLIVVKGPSKEKMELVLTKFCEMYNRSGPITPLKYYNKDSTTYFITFPQDIEFDLFCYLVNFIKYPNDVKYTIDVIGWTTVGRVDGWNTNQLDGQHVVVFLDPADNEYDNVMLTTADNVGFKIGFAVGAGLQKSKRLLDYKLQDIMPSNLSTMHGVVLK